MKHGILKLIFLSCALATIPLMAQWDIRVEIPSASSGNLPDALVAGTTNLTKGTFNTGEGYIISGSKAIFDLGLFSLDGGLEFSQVKTIGSMSQLTTTGLPFPGQEKIGSSLKQQGVGVSLNAIIWAPFIGLGGEFGLIQRFQTFNIDLGTATKSKNLGRTWMRIGARYRIPFIPFDAYVTASWQQPLNATQPVTINSAQSLVDLLNTQGTGQEFNRLWTFGVGVRY